MKIENMISNNKKLIFIILVFISFLVVISLFLWDVDDYHESVESPIVNKEKPSPEPITINQINGTLIDNILPQFLGFVPILIFIMILITMTGHMFEILRN